MTRHRSSRKYALTRRGQRGQAGKASPIQCGVAERTEVLSEFTTNVIRNCQTVTDGSYSSRAGRDAERSTRTSNVRQQEEARATRGAWGGTVADLQRQRISQHRRGLQSWTARWCRTSASMSMHQLVA